MLRNAKFLFISLSLSAFVFFGASAQTFGDQRVGGTIHLKEELRERYNDKGVLFVFVRKHGESDGPPAGVVRIERPKYPQAFVIGPQNAMIPGVPFKGPFTVSARHSLSGKALGDENALEASTGSDEKISLGQRNVSVKLGQ